MRGFLSETCDVTDVISDVENLIEKSLKRRNVRSIEDKPARVIIRLLFGFASNSICQTQQKHQQIVKQDVKSIGDKVSCTMCTWM